MAIALTQKARETVYLKREKDLPHDEKTGFVMAPVKQKVRKVAFTAVAMAEAGIATWTEVLLKACLKGTASDQPLRDADGEPVKFKTTKKGEVHDDWLELLSMEDQIELAENRLRTFIPDDDEGEELDDLGKSEPSSPTA